MSAHDVILLGSDVDALVAAILLARAGRSVCVIEEAPGLTPALAPGELAGVQTPGLHAWGDLRPTVRRALGLRVPSGAGSTPLVCLDAEGRAEPVLLADDGETALEAELALIRREIALLERLVERRPPSILDATMAGLARESLPLAWPMLMLGRRERTGLLRLATMPLADALDERFGDGVLAAGLAAGAMLGSWQGPFAPGTALACWWRWAVSGFPAARVTTPGALCTELHERIATWGVADRTGTCVSEITVERGAVTGVRTASGEHIAAPVVISTLSPRHTLVELIPAIDLPPRLAAEARTMREQHCSSRIDLVLGEGAPLVGRPGRERRPGPAAGHRLDTRRLRRQ
jgi:phytoene dehydrogenase-like protein